jgi:hypothetical protein
MAETMRVSVFWDVTGTLVCSFLFLYLWGYNQLTLLSSKAGNNVPDYVVSHP